MFAPSLKLNNVTIEGGGKPSVVNNPHIEENIETTTIFKSETKYNLTINFSILDQYVDSGIGSWIEDKDLRKYIKISISYYIKSNTTTTKEINLLDQNNLDLINYLKTDTFGNRYYEYPFSYTTEHFSKSIRTQTITVTGYFDLVNYILDQGLSTDGIVNEFGNPLIVKVISNYNIVSSPNIINNSIVEEINKKLINTSFTSDLENRLISIIEKDQKNLDISPYFTNLYISKNESNNNHLLFGIDKKRIIKTKTQFGSYVDNMGGVSTTLSQAIFDNIFVNDIKLIKKQVKKIISTDKLDQKTEDYVEIENFVPVILELNESNITDISLQNDYQFYSVADLTSDNAPENSTFQYSLQLSIQDNFNQILFSFYEKCLNDIKILENYYQIISIPFVDAKLISDNNPHISNTSYETSTVSKAYGYYYAKTNTFKNINASIVPNLDSICLNISSLYFFTYSIGKQDVENVYYESLKLNDEMKKSLIASSTSFSSTLYIIGKTIELIKSFIVNVEKMFNFKIIDTNAQVDSNDTVKVGSSTNNIITLNYTFENIVNNNYYNNFKRNKFMLFQPTDLSYYPTINSSELANFLTNSNGILTPTSNNLLNTIFDEPVRLNSSVNVDSKEFRLLVSYLNNYLIYLTSNDLNYIDFTSSEDYNISIFPSDYVKPYKSLILDILNINNVQVTSFKTNQEIEIVRDPIPDQPTRTSTDPLDYNIPTPRETFVSASPINDALLQNKKHESIDRLLNYILSSYNDELNLTTSYQNYAKKDIDFSNIINQYLPTYSIQFLSEFDGSIKNPIWTNLTSTSFPTLQTRSKLLCRLTPLLNSTSYELKNVINNLQVPYMYFILNKNTTQFSSTNPIVNTVGSATNRPAVTEMRQTQIVQESSNSLPNILNNPIITRR